MIDNRSRIIDAAARVYAAHGYRGATTRRIAEEAGVNEVTIFRQFGSKSALLDTMIEECTDLRPIELPLVPADPEAELTAWVLGHMDDIRGKRALLRQLMREFAEHPEYAECAGKGPAFAAEQLRNYVVAMRRAGMLDDDPATQASAHEVASAITMLMSAFFIDAMDREMMTDLFHTPVADAPRAYVRLFLRSLGFVPAPVSAPTPV